MTPAAAEAMYIRQFAGHGTLILRRLGSPNVDSIPVRGRIVGYEADELVGGIEQGSSRVILLAKDVEAAIAAGWPGPLDENARIVANGRSINIESIDDFTRRIGGVLIAYEIRVKG